MTTRPSEIAKAPAAANGGIVPGAESVKVAVRIRPMSASEQERGCQTVVEQAAPDAAQILVLGGRVPSDIFSYNYVFPPTTAQATLYEASVAPMLPKLFAGYNVTILAYGQTSSGKTFTMGTHFAGEMDRESGVIPRAINDIFRMIATEGDGTANQQALVDTRLSCSFIEVYQDQVYDLLAEKVSGTERQPVEIRETVAGNIVLQGLTEVSADTEQGAFECLARGSVGRVVRATAMNNVSSRSHAIFTLTLHHTARDDPSVVTRSKFHLVDLAGSERSKKTATTGDRFKEGVEINKCLLALGNVITALAAGSGKMHIPYRSSKLTRLLQDSLGGNTYTLMIACVSPSDYNLPETYSTLRYAYRVRKIKNKPIVNQDPQQARIKHLEGIIQDLRVEILSLKSDQEEGKGSRDGEFRVPKSPARASLVRGHTETDLYRGVRKPGENGTRDDNAALHVQKLQEMNRGLQLQLQSTLHELEASEMRAMCAEKLVEDMEKMLHEEREGQANGVEAEMRRGLETLLGAYRDELFALSNKTETILPPSPFARPQAPTGEGADSVRQEEIERKSQFHTQQQLRIHTELTQLKRELTLKEELHRKCTQNSAQVQSITIDREQKLTEQLREYQGQIRTLEEQLNELNAQLENTKASEKRSKLAEERRRKVQQLDAELAELRQKCARQAKLLKLNEKDAQRIAGLSAEIQQMKQTRVKLLKTLRTENESFRQWKQERQKEITQLKAKDRKRQYEMQKLESTYTLQKRIMQRKMDETIVVNKRLKALLERRQRYASATSTSDRAQMRGADATAWIKQELELLYNTVDGSVTQNMLRVQRAHQMKRVDELKKQLRGLIAEAGEGSFEQPVGAQQQELVTEINQLLSDRENRNAQIVDLQRKINEMDADNLVASFGEGLAKLPEGREAFQQVLAELVQIQTNLVETRFRLMDLQATSDCQEEELAVLRNRLQSTEQQYRESVVQLEKTYEDKLSMLLMQRAAGWAGPTTTTTTGAPNDKIKPDGEGEEATAARNGDTDTVLEEAIRRIEELREQLEHYKQSDQILRQELDEMTKRQPRKRRQPAYMMDPDTEFGNLGYDDDEVALNSSEDDERDPDFRGTPLWKRKKSESIIRKTLLSSTLQSNNSTIGRRALVAGNVQPTGCCCAGNCSTRRCGCHKQDNICTAACKCPSGCVNRILPGIRENDPMPMLDGTNGDTSASSTSDALLAANVSGQPSATVDNKENRTDETFVMPEVPDQVMTAQMIEDREKLDILEYVAKYRKRKPLIDI